MYVLTHVSALLALLAASVSANCPRPVVNPADGLYHPVDFNGTYNVINGVWFPHYAIHAFLGIFKTVYGEEIDRPRWTVGYAEGPNCEYTYSMTNSSNIVARRIESGATKIYRFEGTHASNSFKPIAGRVDMTVTQYTAAGFKTANYWKITFERGPTTGAGFYIIRPFTAGIASTKFYSVASA